MDNLDLLFKNNDGKYRNYQIRNNKIIFTFNDETLNGNTIKNVILSINLYLKKYINIHIPIIFNFSNKELKIADKLSYILLECICYYIIEEYHISLRLIIHPKTDILTQGIISSPLSLLTSKKNENIKKYPQKFKKEIYNSHYRKIISGKDKKETNYLGITYTEIDSFLKFFNIDPDYRNDISEVITELIGNACEHANSNCLIDIDVTSDYKKSEEGKNLDGNYYGVNIIILNFSDTLLSDALKDKIFNSTNLNNRYLRIKNAYDYHKNFFDDNYDETDFFNISVFQNKISGRINNSQSGGTGLTLLIKSLQDKSDSNKCYLISGDKAIFFHNNLLDYTQEDWIGFNESHQYFNDIPSITSIGRCYIFLPGTGYNLNFVMKRED